MSSINVSRELCLILKAALICITLLSCFASSENTVWGHGQGGSGNGAPGDPGPNPDNGIPVSVDDSFTLYDRDVQIDCDVLANDYDIDGELDYGSISIIDTANFGIASVNASGSVQYVVNPGFIGLDSFTYTVMDNELGRSREARATISVEESPDRVEDQLPGNWIGTLDVSAYDFPAWPHRMAGNWDGVGVASDGSSHTFGMELESRQRPDAGGGSYLYVKINEFYIDGDDRFLTSLGNGFGGSSEDWSFAGELYWEFWRDQGSAANYTLSLQLDYGHTLNGTLESRTAFNGPIVESYDISLQIDSSPGPELHIPVELDFASMEVPRLDVYTEDGMIWQRDAEYNIFEMSPSVSVLNSNTIELSIDSSYFLLNTYSHYYGWTTFSWVYYLVMNSAGNYMTGNLVHRIELPNGELPLEWAWPVSFSKL
jgi:hypothetical protein